MILFRYMTPSQLGFVQGAAIAAIAFVLHYVATNIAGAGIVSESAAGIIAAFAMSLENFLITKTGKGLLGSTRIRG